VVVVAIVVVGALQLLPRSAGPAAGATTVPGTRTAAGILVPLSGTNVALASGRSLGLANAPLKLIVWSDFQCPACKLFATTIEPDLIRDYVITGKLLLEYRDHTIIGPESQAAAAGARCADQQDRFWPYHDILFANQGAENSGSITPKRLGDMADAVGLDRAKFDACLPGQDLFNAIEGESAQGNARNKSTPALDFGTEVIAGSPPYAQLKVKIDSLLAALPAAPAPTSAPSGT
jgi:protein-disulfide isomerase